MNPDPSGFQELEAVWEEATGALRRRELALAEAMRAYRRNTQQCTTSRVAEALAKHNEAKEAVEGLMRTIWRRLP